MVYRRHVCVQNKVVTRPIKQVESYCKPVYKTYTYVCDKEKYRLCSSFRVVYEKALRTVHKIAAQTETLYVCCPGWTQVSQAKHDCTQAICIQECKNGGKCKKPDHCHCPLGWTGKSCDIGNSFMINTRENFTKGANGNDPEYFNILTLLTNEMTYKQDTTMSRIAHGFNMASTVLFPTC
ncbi:epidermal growth factor-like protein 8, partial [Centruroides sculpturatus]|uniref:epidermal growth factor-like protein 8 n=1 Tax=Centruroides sculpturatus TaxID=218467 RepID=UPI000C6E1C25